MRSPWHETPRRRVVWFALIAAVLLAHGLFAVRVAANMIGWNTGSEPKRIQVALVQELSATAPPVPSAVAPVHPVAPPRSPHAAPVPRRPRPPRPASAPERQPPRQEAESASAPVVAEQEQAPASAGALGLVAPGPPEERLQDGLTPDELRKAAEKARAAYAASLGASIPAPGASAAADGPPQPAMDWPPSTRLTYTLTGLFRNGPLYGTAAVEWRREGTHYQVEFNIHVTPFMDQHMFSDGQITDDGLSPHHYEETRTMLLGSPRAKHIEFDGPDITLTDGNHVPSLPQTQDPSSQFVQFVWMFSTHPEWLRPGNVVGIALALPTNLHEWNYVVGQVETLHLPFGDIDALHLSPQPHGPRRPNEYPFEIWTAPTLQYLPVRIRVQLDDTNFADLALDSKPLQAARTPAAPAATASSGASGAAAVPAAAPSSTASAPAF